MRKILIITYYWPPCGGAGVQRWLKFAKYLREFNYEPIIYTVKNGEFPEIDESLINDIPDNLIVLKKKIWEPYKWYKLFIKQNKDQKINTAFLTEKKKSPFLEKISVWIRGNFFIPDARKFWIKPSARFLIKYISENPVRLIISTGPPHSMHLIAYRIKQKLNIPWISDFRDPWTNIDFYNELMLTKRANKKHNILEHKVLHHSDLIIAISKTMRKEFVFLNARQVEVIPNGYDNEDIPQGRLKLDEKFSMVHIGSLVKTRNPQVLWKVLSEIISSNKSFENDLEVKLVGKTDYSVIESLKRFNIKKNVTITNYLSHKEAIDLQQRSQILLLLINRTKNAMGILTGKIFEYMSSKRPILLIGPADGDAAEIINETNTGKVVDFDDEIYLKKIVNEYYDLFKNKKLGVESKGIEKYSRRELTKKLAVILDKFVE